MRLQGTLTRVDAETYGICTDCGEPIPLKRLMLMPETGRCMACMSGRDA
jgi:DnaK suppressor protein